MPDLVGPKIAYYGFTGIIEPSGVTRLAAALNEAANRDYDEVVLCVSSMGGYVADGIFLYNHLRSLPLKITIYNTGSISSIAVAVFIGGAERYCSPHAMFMIHPTTLSPGQEGMSAERLQASLQAALADDMRTENILRERTSIPEEILSVRRFKDVFIVPNDAVKFGLVDGVRDFSLPSGSKIIQI